MAASRAKRIGSGLETVVAEGTAFAVPFWRPDNSGIVFCGNITVPGGAIRDVLEVNLDGTGLRQVTNSADFIETWAEILP